ncbi:uncharacterized protein LOC128816882 isoform X2 [Vidua macroura]|uniref:uncharacterized protein LOC128816882 isoform X2 n=1 Tax=Vidua macroura TaxID=187451 RepID=UPI0023A7BA99|nr:uncharacterized protein LOC128816882 isoform X2 [Vidua macroura]
MATLTLGQMLDAALGSSRAGVIDFEQLHNLLNGMLLHLGLRDLLVQESGEPLEGAEESPFSFLKELKQKVEANEKEIAEVRALCQELREEVNEVKLEQSHMAEDMQYMLQNFDMEGFQNMMDDLRNQLLDSLMSAMKDMMQGGQGSPDKQQHAGPKHLDPWDDPGLIVIGNEITLVEKPRTPRHGNSQPASPLPPDAKTQGRGKEANASSDPVSVGENDMGQNVEESNMGQNRGRNGMGQRGMGWSMGQNYMGRNMGQRDMRRNVQWSNAEQNDMGQDIGQKDMGRNMGQRDMRRNVQWSNAEQNDMGQDIGQKDMGRNMGQRDMRRNVQWSNAEQNDMGQDIGQKDMGRNMGQRDMRRNVQWSNAEQNDMGQDIGQKDMGRNVGQRDMRRNVQWSNAEQNDMGQDIGQKDMGPNVGQRDMRRNVQWSNAEQNDMGQDIGQKDMGRNVGQRDMRRNVQWSNAEQNDMGQDIGQKDMGPNVGQRDMRRNVQWSNAEQNDMGQDIGQKDMGPNVGQRDMRRNVQWSNAEQNDMGQDDMGQIKDEEIEIRISKAEALPSPRVSPPEMTSKEEIKEEDTKMSISKAPPRVQKKSSDGSFTTSGTHPRAPGTHVSVQRVQSVRGHPGSQSLWIPAESVAGTSRLPTSKEARGRGSIRMEAFPAEAGLILLKVPSSEYTPCDQLVQLPGRHSEVNPSTPPPSPGFSVRLPHARRQRQPQEHREQAAERYPRRSPMYSGGKHTSVCPVQPMEPLLPDPNKPGTFDLMGRDGVVYRGRTPPGMD